MNGVFALDLQVRNISMKELWKPTLDEDNSGSSKSCKSYPLLLLPCMLAIWALMPPFKEQKPPNVILVVI